MRETSCISVSSKARLSVCLQDTNVAHHIFTSAHTAVSSDVLGQLAKDYSENNSYVKELPSLVQREFSRALVVAGSTMDHDHNRQQYFHQV